jgi:hypothetical protein
MDKSHATIAQRVELAARRRVRFALSLAAYRFNLAVELSDSKLLFGRRLGRAGCERTVTSARNRFLITPHFMRFLVVLVPSENTNALHETPHRVSRSNPQFQSCECSMNGED